MLMTNSELYITAYMRNISGFVNRKRLVFLFRRIIEWQDINHIENNYCPRDGGYITFCPSNGECSEKCKDCWQKAIDKLKEEGEPIL